MSAQRQQACLESHYSSFQTSRAPLLPHETGCMDLLSFLCFSGACGSPVHAWCLSHHNTLSRPSPSSQATVHYQNTFVFSPPPGGSMLSTCQHGNREVTFSYSKLMCCSPQRPQILNPNSQGEECGAQCCTGFVDSEVIFLCS